MSASVSMEQQGEVRSENRVGATAGLLLPAALDSIPGARGARSVRRVEQGQRMQSCPTRFPLLATHSRLSRFRQRDRNIQHLVVAFADEVDLDRLVFDLHVLADYFQQFALEHGQVVGTAASASGTLVRDDDAQAVLGDVGGGLLGDEEIEQ